MNNGFIHIYTGNGKGKTTAAIGLAVRAAGAGLKSYIIQFMKEYPYSELVSLQNLDQWITIEQCGSDEFVLNGSGPSKEEVDKVKNKLEEVKGKLRNSEYDIVILDEICVSIYFGLLSVEDVLPVIDAKPVNVELVLTGRYCPQELIDRADLVSEIQEVKHYYCKGILARKGIES